MNRNGLEQEIHGQNELLCATKDSTRHLYICVYLQSCTSITIVYNTVPLDKENWQLCMNSRNIWQQVSKCYTLYNNRVKPTDVVIH
ncbi:hypothetical protein GDO81_013436 [Engystomops pustulosus]|uniref:Uncharacterized protein n=1 Tax=Engystomops pustulosus TaxID=76066 RepID=A0AAV7B4E9_ENGPU|nr:hypothetical protein GDO81_013436 [Engystomops pustulosus]